MADSKAEKIAAGSVKAPAQIEEAKQDVIEASDRVEAGIEESLKTGELRDNVHRFAVQDALAEAAAADEPTEEQEKLLQEYESGGLHAASFREHSGLTADEARERADEVAEDWFEGTTYAYRFEVLDDDSVLAVYVTKAGEEPQLKAFPDMDATRGWHPVRNPEG
jgi:hypothetical protein